MIDISALEEYFPKINTPIIIGEFTFTISLNQENDAFGIDLKIRSASDNKKEHYLKFRVGMGIDEPQENSVHKTDEPHFEVDIYKREDEAFSATLYFTFKDKKDEELMEYVKGTVVLIGKIIQQFIKNNGLELEKISELIYLPEVTEELGACEPKLIEALYELYKNSDLIVRIKGEEAIIVKTEHNLKKYLSDNDLAPLYKQLTEKIKEDKTSL